MIFSPINQLGCLRISYLEEGVERCHLLSFCNNKQNFQNAISKCHLREISLLATTL